MQATWMPSVASEFTMGEGMSLEGETAEEERSLGTPVAVKVGMANTCSELTVVNI